jgi:integrase
VELVNAYNDFADGYYRKAGKPTGEATNVKYAMRPLKRLYGHTLARDFGPLALEALREEIIASGICRNEVNRRVRIIVRCFKWAVSKQLVPPSVHHGLQAVPGLRRGRSEARETDPVKPVPDAFVDAIRPFISAQVWAMIEIQRYTAMRPGEVIMMRTCDIDTSGRIWIYTPQEHKTEYCGRRREVYLGPGAQSVLRPWLRTELQAYVFQPREAVAEWRAKQRKQRKSKVQPSQISRAKRGRKEKVPGEKYTTDSYREAIIKGCARAFPHPELSKIPRKELTPEQRAELKRWVPAEAWHPNQLRHNAATRLRKEFGLDVAQIILGHSTAVVTEIYAEADREKALEVVARIG